MPGTEKTHSVKRMLVPQPMSQLALEHMRERVQLSEQHGWYYDAYQRDDVRRLLDTVAALQASLSRAEARAARLEETRHV